MSKEKALILGGNRFFGRHLALELIEAGVAVTLLNRGRHDDGLGDRIHRLHADRTNAEELRRALDGGTWDMVFDQICFTADEARNLCRLLKGRTRRIVFTSSQSVYPWGENLSEDVFDPAGHTFTTEVSAKEDYAEAKRQAEAEFIKHPDLRPLLVRMPLVVGTDDYTGRLKWHVDRIRQGLPIYFPNLEARMGFIRSDIAGRALAAMAGTSLAGAVNCVCPGTLALEDLVRMIESSTGREMVRASSPDAENHSPYGVPETWTMSTAKLNSAKITLPELQSWMPELINEIAGR